jgi:hypothetical protein
MGLLAYVNRILLEPTDSTNSVEDRVQREGDLGEVAPLSGFPLNLQMSETHILIRLLQMYFPQNWEFGSALSKFLYFNRVVFEPPKPPSVHHWMVPDHGFCHCYMHTHVCMCVCVCVCVCGRTLIIFCTFCCLVTELQCIEFSHRSLCLLS